MSLRVQIAGCTGQNDGFDGYDYQPVWPDGNTKLHPTPIQFSSPLTGLSALTSYWHSGRGDNFTTVNRGSVAIGSGYSLVRTEGYTFATRP